MKSQRKTWHSEAPTNIALIKYMGKKDATLNIPTNASFSYTLDSLKSFVELELSEEKVDTWQSLSLSAPHSDLYANSAFLNEPLNPKEQQRFLQHLIFLKKQFNYAGNFIVRSANNFPAGCGLASSASSFAALTSCAVNALTELTGIPTLDQHAIADLSRQGSGSSCRSFFTPWALWRDDKVERVKLPYENLLHDVIVITQQKKIVSSSEAHRRVQTSPLFEGRVERAEMRLNELLQSLQQENWPSAFKIVWQEFQDIHRLFATATQPFDYLLPESRRTLDYLNEYWENNNDGPLVTLDAGPNIHLLYRPDQKKMKQEIKDKLRAVESRTQYLSKN